MKDKSCNRITIDSVGCTQCSNSQTQCLSIICYRAHQAGTGQLEVIKFLRQWPDNKRDTAKQFCTKNCQFLIKKKFYSDNNSDLYLTLFALHSFLHFSTSAGGKSIGEAPLITNIEGVIMCTMKAGIAVISQLLLRHFWATLYSKFVKICYLNGSTTHVTLYCLQ